MNQRLTAAQADRAAGVLLGAACGDALGAPYEFGPAMADNAPVGMIGGGPFGWAPAEWTDDTSMSVPILEAAEVALESSDDLLDHVDLVVARWCEWAATANDVGIQTRSVLAAASASGPPTAGACRGAAQRHLERTGKAAGNGSLMRTAPVALAYLDDVDGLAATSRAISDLTHPEPDAGDACVLWCAAIRHAVLAGVFDIRVGLGLLPAERAALWKHRIEEAESRPQSHFSHNGWVVHALQAAWSAIVHTPVPALDPSRDSYPAQHLRLTLESIARTGGDTDTVAAIAGALLGARWGSSAVPSSWRRHVHGWPALHVGELSARGHAVAAGVVAGSAWPLVPRIDYRDFGATGVCVEHPHDPGVLLGDALTVDLLSPQVDAVVSLCRVGDRQPDGLPPERRVTVWLIDVEDPDSNPNLDFVLADTADLVASMRGEGLTVLLHCVAAQSRTPTVAAAYAVRHCRMSSDAAMRQVLAALPGAHPNPAFRRAIAALSESPATGTP